LLLLEHQKTELLAGERKKPRMSNQSQNQNLSVERVQVSGIRLSPEIVDRIREMNQDRFSGKLSFPKMCELLIEEHLNSIDIPKMKQQFQNNQN